MPYKNSLNVKSAGGILEAANHRCQCPCVCKRIVQDRSSQLCGPCKDVCSLVTLQNCDDEGNPEPLFEKDERRGLSFSVNGGNDTGSGKGVAMSYSNNLNVMQPSVVMSSHASPNISAQDCPLFSTTADRGGRQQVVPLCSCLCGCRRVVRRAYMGRCEPCIWQHPA